MIITYCCCYSYIVNWNIIELIKIDEFVELITIILDTLLI